MKYRYATTEDNQLLVSTGRSKKPVIASGEFEIDKANALFYRLNAPAAWRRKYRLPEKIGFQGSWRLDPEHNLQLVLDQTQNQDSDGTLTLRGRIIAIDGDTIVFEFQSRDRRGTSRLATATLGVTWLSDEANRISFVVKKRLPDIVTLEGEWQLNSHQELVYKYERAVLKTKTREEETLVFRGFWKISATDRLTYIIEHSLDSKFDFRAQIESPTLYPQEGVVKYRLGAGLTGDSRKPKIISLYGAWKFARKVGLVFAMEYAHGRLHLNEFGADILFSKKDTVTFCLRNSSGEALGISVVFSHRFLKAADAEFFLKLKERSAESRLEAGIRIPF